MYLLTALFHFNFFYTVPYTPFFNHLESYSKHKDDPNVLFVSYEELSNDPATVIQVIIVLLCPTLFLVLCY